MSSLLPPPQTLNPPSTSVCPPKPTYSHISTVPILTPSGPANLITIAGQIGCDPSGHVPPTYTAQVELAYSNLGKCLAEVGGTPRDIIGVRHYIVNHDEKDRSRAECYMRFMGDHRPPSTLVGVAKLAEPEMLYEIEATAIIGRRE